MMRDRGNKRQLEWWRERKKERDSKREIEREIKRERESIIPRQN